jgi:hypothetical protein
MIIPLKIFIYFNNTQHFTRRHGVEVLKGGRVPPAVSLSVMKRGHGQRKRFSSCSRRRKANGRAMDRGKGSYPEVNKHGKISHTFPTTTTKSSTRLAHGFLPNSTNFYLNNIKFYINNTDF